MISPAPALFYYLPAPAKALAAAALGRYLRWWRYGPESGALTRQALARDRWSAERWRSWREQRLAALLERAATRVPYYREHWRRRRLAGDRGRFEELASWPILDKETVRRDPRAFLADGCRPWRMYSERTSGSTGTPLPVWWSRRTTTAWFALVEARVRLWHGVDRGKRWAMIGGRRVVPADRGRPPYWIWNRPLRQLYLSCFHISPESAGAYAGALERYRVRSLHGYPSALSALASLALDAGISMPRLRLVISNAETLAPRQREVIERAFGCPVRDTYGLAELVCAASECDAGRLHLWPEVGVTEVLGPDGQALAPGETGRIVATGLLNADMPLVRYDTGDEGSLAPPGRRCSCGAGLPVLAEIAGRRDDVLVTPEGRRIGRLDGVFKAELPIREAQIVQTSRRRIVVKVVPAAGFGRRHAERIAGAARSHLGSGFDVAVEEVDALPRDAAGKRRLVVALADGT